MVISVMVPLLLLIGKSKMSHGKQIRRIHEENTIYFDGEFVLGTCQLAVLSGAADELDVKKSTVELSNNSVENGEVENVEVSSETASQQVAEKVESISETKENLLPSIITDRSG